MLNYSIADLIFLGALINIDSEIIPISTEKTPVIASFRSESNVHLCLGVQVSPDMLLVLKSCHDQISQVNMPRMVVLNPNRDGVGIRMKISLKKPIAPHNQFALAKVIIVLYESLAVKDFHMNRLSYFLYLNHIKTY